jgi:hypothetical protein
VDVAPDGIPIAFTALTKGVPVVSASGHRFGTVDQVLEEPSEDIFHGLVVATPAGLRFVDRDHVERMTTTGVICALSEEQVAALPAASAPSRGGDRSGVPVRSLSGTSWIRTSWFGPSWFRPRRRFGPVVIVRCARGALFQTIWIPMVSVVRCCWSRTPRSGQPSSASGHAPTGWITR